MTDVGVPLGSLETELIRYIAIHPNESGRQIADALAEERGVARTTVLTVLERLRKKGLVSRRKRAGIYCYQAQVPASQAMRSTVERFVTQILGGSVTPVLAFLADTDELSDEDVDELERLVKAQRERRIK
ncbi:MAG TPA: BlaI/MecI/CopY family transcriptional regulator [Fimbriimonadaceae bacterium]|nr:BlaI/MecI/CopY family transcriptional regulator [Fimbriimonadaceae bacterium]